jgi:peptidoglycan L-alanyl-D-glutamate endopeptidase CwlK
MSLTDRDRRRLAGVHPDIVRVVERAAREGGVRFIVTEGLRTMDRQSELVRAGRSQTMRSRHLTGHAVDLAVLDDAGAARWDKPAYVALAAAMKAAAKAEGVTLEWGGDWRSFFDGPHFQLPWAAYPAAPFAGGSQPPASPAPRPAPP